MAGRVTVLTPVNNSDAIELGRSTWRKQILPVGELQFGDRKLKFTRGYLDNLVAAFRDRAFDACPLQLADASNSHTNDVNRAAGEVIGLEATNEGLYATVSATDKGAEILREHPNLGVSVRIVEDYERQTGQGSKAYPAALQHVLCTWAPRIASMKPWEPINCSEETDDVLDLSALTFTADGTAVAPQTPATVTPGVGTDPATSGDTEETVATFTDEQIAKLLTLIEGGGTDSATDEQTAPTETTTVVAPPAEVTAEADEDEQVEQAIAAATGEGEHNVVDLAVVELRTIADRQAIELAEIKAERDQEKWNYEREQLVRQYGIPPAIVNLAEPLLKGSKRVVELAEGGTVDAGAVMRSVLTTVAKTYGKRVDLSSELLGDSREAGAEDEAKAARDRIHQQARAAGFGK